MCGIFLTDNETLDKVISDLVIKRGKDFHKFIDYNGFKILSSVLQIRSTIEQPIVEKNFLFQYNGEIYNDHKSDTIYIKDVISEEFLSKKHISDEEGIFELLTRVYNRLNQDENEMAISIVFDNFVSFYKDDIGKRSLGYNLNPFVLSSVGYSNELDPMKFYIYNKNTKTLSSKFKPKKLNNLVSAYLDRFSTISQYIFNDKFRNEFHYISGYENYFENKEIDRVCSFKTHNERVIVLNSLLLKAFAKRKFYTSPVVFLSGGIDSLIIAIYTHLTINKDEIIYLINTALLDSFDREMGVKAFEDLKIAFPERKFIFIENNLDLNSILEHRNSIETLIGPKKSKMDFNIGSVMYFSAKAAFKFSKVAFLGSGADEIFGGYNKYKNSIDFRNNMLFDLFTISSHNLCRDDRVVGNWNLEARFPFLDSEIILFSLSLSDDDLILNGENKHILRSILRLHGFIRAAEVPKKAMQYGTGMSLFEKELYKEL